MTEKSKNRNMGLLFLTAFIWGTAFVAQSVGSGLVEPFTFNGTRCLIGAATLFLCILILNRKKTINSKEYKKKDLAVGGLLCGILLFVASSLQQIGIQYTTAGKSGFITAFYIVFVPVLGIFMRKKVGARMWFAVLIALSGLYLLCVNEAFHVELGDFLILICAIVFSMHILVIDHFSPKVEGIKMSCIQFFVAGILSLPFMFLLETPEINTLMLAWLPLLYTGVLSCGVAYTLQIIGQKNVNPTVASLILSLEACISVLAGWIILGERLPLREGIGCMLMLGAILLTQLPVRIRKGRVRNEICNSTSE